VSVLGVNLVILFDKG